MYWLVLCFSLLVLSPGFSTPPTDIPEELKSAYTLDGDIPIESWYFDSTYSTPLFYSKEEISSMIDRISLREVYYYGATDTYLYAAIEDHLEHIEGKDVAIMGSTIPWYESIVLFYGGIPTTIEYNQVESDDPRLNLITVSEYEKKPKLFDAVISISSYEHDGLGRYGDPLNPYGDFHAMEKTKSMLKEGGLLFLAVPVGKDALVWNAHRVYGPIRLPILLQGWNTIATYGFDKSNFLVSRSDHQPVFVLSQ